MNLQGGYESNNSGGRGRGRGQGQGQDRNQQNNSSKKWYQGPFSTTLNLPILTEIPTLNKLSQGLSGVITSLSGTKLEERPSSPEESDQIKLMLSCVQQGKEQVCRSLHSKIQSTSNMSKENAVSNGRTVLSLLQAKKIRESPMVFVKLLQCATELTKKLVATEEILIFVEKCAKEAGGLRLRMDESNDLRGMVAHNVLACMDEFQSALQEVKSQESKITMTGITCLATSVTCQRIKGNLMEAYKIAMISFDMLNSLGNEGSHHYLSHLNNLGCILEEVGSFHEAKKIYLMALDLACAIEDFSDITDTSYALVINCYRYMGQFKGIHSSSFFAYLERIFVRMNEKADPKLSFIHRVRCLRLGLLFHKDFNGEIIDLCKNVIATEMCAISPEECSDLFEVVKSLGKIYSHHGYDDDDLIVKLLFCLSRCVGQKRGIYLGKSSNQVTDFIEPFMREVIRQIKRRSHADQDLRLTAEAFCLKHISWSYLQVDQYKLSLLAANEALECFQQNRNIKLEQLSSVDELSPEVKLGNNDGLLPSHLDIKIIQQHQNLTPQEHDVIELELRHYMAVCYFEMKDFEKAECYFEEVIALREKHCRYFESYLDPDVNVAQDYLRVIARKKEKKIKFMYL